MLKSEGEKLKGVGGSVGDREREISNHFFFLIVCLNFNTAKFSSIVVSVPLVCKSSSKIPEISSPLFCMSAFCVVLSCTVARSLMLLDYCLIFAKASMIVRVA